MVEGRGEGEAMGLSQLNTNLFACSKKLLTCDQIFYIHFTEFILFNYIRNSWSLCPTQGSRPTPPDDETN